MPPHGARLMRSRKNRMIGGVCGGIGEYFNIDPTIIRIIAVVMLLFPVGPVFFAYILAWIIIPLDNR
ncbi:MAG: PspC domain-containing protein [Coriobacteriia bacterium]|nr:PspC domain-containing protein [Coriobacteriia bacterium]